MKKLFNNIKILAKGFAIGVVASVLLLGAVHVASAQFGGGFSRTFWQMSGDELTPVNSNAELGSSSNRITKGWFDDIDATTATISALSTGDLDLAGNDLLNADEVRANYFTATSTSATSTFAGGLAIETTGLVYVRETNFLALGTASPKVQLDVTDGGTTPSANSGVMARFSNTSDASDNARISIISGTSGSSYVEFGDSADDVEGMIEYNQSNSEMSFFVNDSEEQLRVNATGVGVGVTPLDLLHISGSGVGGIDFLMTDESQGSDLKNFVISNRSQTLQIGTQNDASTNFSAKMTVNRNGEFGIGQSPVSGSLFSLPQQNDAVTPTLSFGDGDTGIYESSDDVLSLSVGGTDAWSTQALYLMRSLSGVNRAAIMDEETSITNPVIIPNRQDLTAGIGSGTAGTLAFITGGVSGLFIDTSQRVGIATTTPQKQLTVEGSVMATECELTDGATVTFNADDCNQGTVVLGGNRTIDFTNWDDSAGQKFTLNLCQDGAGSRTVTWDSEIKWLEGEEPTLTTTGGVCDVFAGYSTAGTSTPYIILGSAGSF